MRAKKTEPLIQQVTARIEKIGEREAFSKLIEAGVSFSMTTKLVARRYCPNGLRDGTTGKLQKFLKIAS